MQVDHKRESLADIAHATKSRLAGLRDFSELYEWEEVRVKEKLPLAKPSFNANANVSLGSGEAKEPSKESKEPRRVAVLQTSIVDQLIRLYNQGYNPLVINCASPNSQGDGWLFGNDSPEAHLFRCTTLSLSLNRFEYPFETGTGMLSPHVYLVRDAACNWLLDKNNEGGFECQVLSLPAVNRPAVSKDGRFVRDEQVDSIKRRIFTMFDKAKTLGHDSVVLGAWGCPDSSCAGHMAELFAEMFRNYQCHVPFKKVSFAIPDPALGVKFASCLSKF